ncbi:MAG: HD domain-containing protein [Anaerolineales bacterium]|nr:HD domain-containing protein [Anaerolineales bacterium]
MRSKADHPGNLLPDSDIAPLVRAYFEFNHLKQLYRRGWLLRGIPPERCESVAEHSWGVAMLSMLLAGEHDPGLDLLKVLRMALIHDLGEVYAGDIVPGEAVSPAEKHARELDSLQHFLAGLPNAEDYLQLWLEFEAGDSLEARFVRQIDKLEMALQASVYEHQALADLAVFYQSAGEGIGSEDLVNLLKIIKTLRRP